MAENSKIEWTKHTFNPWRGCTKVSPGCVNCYAETLSGRNHKVLGTWGPRGTRVVASEEQWRLPLAWDRRAVSAGERHRVFCASLADVFEDWTGPMAAPNRVQVWKRADHGNEWTTSDHYRDTIALTMDDVRVRLFRLIADTPHLDWLLLTKRADRLPQWFPYYCGGAVMARANDGLPVDHLHTGGPYLPNVWLGTSVEDQARADERIPHLLATPAAVRFLSAEPLLGPIDLTRIPVDGGHVWDVIRGRVKGTITRDIVPTAKVDWVIVGGESGRGARPLQVEWVRDIVGQCRSAGVPCFVKQLGANAELAVDPESVRGKRSFSVPIVVCDGRVTLKMTDPKGGEPSEWPEELRVREFPKPTGVP